MESVPIPGKQTSFGILQLFDTWRYQSLVILWFSFVVTLIKMNQMVLVLNSSTIHDLKLTRLSTIISPYFAKFT